MKKSAVPGPGTYKPRVSMNENGVYALSSMQSKRATAWYPSNRFSKPKESRESSPGPG